jgi:hypothetical protein
VRALSINILWAGSCHWVSAQPLHLPTLLSHPRTHCTLKTAQRRTSCSSRQPPLWSRAQGTQTQSASPSNRRYLLPSVARSRTRGRRCAAPSYVRIRVLARGARYVFLVVLFAFWCLATTRSDWIQVSAGRRGTCYWPAVPGDIVLLNLDGQRSWTVKSSLHGERPDCGGRQDAGPRAGLLQWEGRGSIARLHLHWRPGACQQLWRHHPLRPSAERCVQKPSSQVTLELSMSIRIRPICKRSTYIQQRKQMCNPLNRQAVCTGYRHATNEIHKIKLARAVGARLDPLDKIIGGFVVAYLNRLIVLTAPLARSGVPAWTLFDACGSPVGNEIQCASCCGNPRRRLCGCMVD